MEVPAMRMRKYRITCSGRTDDKHPKRLIATITDMRRPIPDRDKFMQDAIRAMEDADRAQGVTRSPEEYRRLAIGQLGLATHLDYIGARARRTNAGASYSTPISAGTAKETTQGARSFRFRCGCGLDVEMKEERLELLAAGLAAAGESECDLFALACTLKS